MNASPLARLAGPLSILAGGTFVVAQAIQTVTTDPTSKLATIQNPLFYGAQVLFFAGFCVLLIALAGVYSWMDARSGLVGFLAFAAAVVGTMNLAGNVWFDTFAAPWLFEAAPDVASNPSGSILVGGFSSYLLFALGWVAFGLASLRSAVFPRILSMAIAIAGAIGYLALLPPFGIPLGLAVAALGVWLVRASSGDEAHAAAAA